MYHVFRNAQAYRAEEPVAKIRRSDLGFRAISYQKVSELL